MTRPDDWADYLDPEVDDPELTPAERAALDRIAGVLADEGTWGEPPAGLRSSLLERAAHEAATRSVDGGAGSLASVVTPPVTPAVTPGVTPGVTSPATPAAAPTIPQAPSNVPYAPSATPRRIGSARARRSWWLSAAGVAAAALLIGVVAWPHPQTTTFAMAGTALAPKASAVAELEPRSAGVAIRLEIKGLTAAPPGAYYAAWLKGPTGVVPVGTFHWHKGGIPIDLWSGVGSDAYPQLFVTLQREGQPPDPSNQVVLTGHVAG
jgi:hypothetical protein